MRPAQLIKENVVPRQAESSKLIPIFRKPGDIVFVRSRMMYARAALNADGDVRFGLRHIRKYSTTQKRILTLTRSDVFNRYSDDRNRAHTAQLLKYIFPKQFGLHNPFTSSVDPRETVQPFKDYTLREHEISEAIMRTRAGQGAGSSLAKDAHNYLPKRLRGDLLNLIQKLQRLHERCSYVELLKHYCPSDVSLIPSRLSTAQLY